MSGPAVKSFSEQGGKGKDSAGGSDGVSRVICYESVVLPLLQLVSVCSIVCGLGSHLVSLALDGRSSFVQARSEGVLLILSERGLGSHLDFCLLISSGCLLRNSLGIGSDPGLLFSCSISIDLIKSSLLSGRDIEISFNLQQCSLVVGPLCDAKLINSLSLPGVLLSLCGGRHNSLGIGEGEGCDEGSGEEKLHLLNFYFFIIIPRELPLISRVNYGWSSSAGQLRSKLSRGSKSELAFIQIN